MLEHVREKNQNYVERFIAHCELVRGLSTRTCQEYGKDMAAFLSWCSHFSAPLDLAFTLPSICDGYVAALVRDGLSPAAIARRVSCLRTFFRYMCRQGLMAENPAEYTSHPRIPYQVVKPANDAVVREFLRRPATTFATERLRVCVALLYACGLRLDEVLLLSSSDFDLERHSIRVQGKGRKQRVVFYHHTFASIIDPYVHLHGGQLFASVSPVTIRYDMARHLRYQGRGIHPHQIRHLFAVNAIVAGMPIEQLSIILGHASVTTTERYLRSAEGLITQSVPRYLSALE